MARTYLRDGRSPTPKNERISAHMSKIRARNTAPNWQAECVGEHGLRGYRLHYKGVQAGGSGFVGKKVAVSFTVVLA